MGAVHWLQTTLVDKRRGTHELPPHLPSPAIVAQTVLTPSPFRSNRACRRSQRPPCIRDALRECLTTPHFAAGHRGNARPSPSAAIARSPLISDVTTSISQAGRFNNKQCPSADTIHLVGDAARWFWIWISSYSVDRSVSGRHRRSPIGFGFGYPAYPSIRDDTLHAIPCALTHTTVRSPQLAPHRALCRECGGLRLDAAPHKVV